MDLQVGEEPNIDSSMAAQAHSVDDTVGNTEPSAGSEPTNDDFTTVDETNGRSSNSSTMLVYFTMSSLTGIFEAIGSNSLSLLLEKLIMLQGRIRAMISRHQRILRLLWSAFRAVVSTLAFIVICWELHGMRTQLKQRSSFETRSLHGTVEQASRLPAWFGWTWPLIFGCAFVSYRHRKRRSKSFDGSVQRHAETEDVSLPIPSQAAQGTSYRATGAAYRPSESSNRTPMRPTAFLPSGRCSRCRGTVNVDGSRNGCLHCFGYTPFSG